MAVRFQTESPTSWPVAGLVFTNWRFIRPGHLRWNDDEGRNVSVYGDEGPLDAHFRFTEAPYGIRLRAHPGQKMPSPVVPEEAWESGGINVGSWLQDDGLIRAWGSCGPESGERYLFYAESTDGESWDRPKLGLQEFHGSRDNNLFAPADEFGNVFIDPSADDDERYKWVLSQHISREEYDRYRARRPMPGIRRRTESTSWTKPLRWEKAARFCRCAGRSRRMEFAGTSFPIRWLSNTRTRTWSHTTIHPQEVRGLRARLGCRRALPARGPGRRSRAQLDSGRATLHRAYGDRRLPKLPPLRHDIDSGPDMLPSGRPLHELPDYDSRCAGPSSDVPLRLAHRERHNQRHPRQQLRR